MTITQKNTNTSGIFIAKENDITAGEMTYVWAGPDRMIIDHTEVDPPYNGKGVGNEMVKKAVDYARENKVKILPLCSFAKSVFDKTPEYNDVLAS